MKLHVTVVITAIVDSEATTLVGAKSVVDVAARDLAKQLTKDGHTDVHVSVAVDRVKP